MQYRRAKTPGAAYFFTVNLAERQSDTLVRYFPEFRESLQSVKTNHPFAITAMVVLPEHLHAIWRLPDHDADYSTRWSLIKAGFSRRIQKIERISASRRAKRERGIWQRRFWEHRIRDEEDLARHVDYIHFNPVKHGLVHQPSDWPHSTIHKYIDQGLLHRDWGGRKGEEAGGFGER